MSGFDEVYELDRDAICDLLDYLGVDPDELPRDTHSMRVALDGGLKVSVDRGVWSLPIGVSYL